MCSEKCRGLGLLALRVVLAGIFIYAGYGKLFTNHAGATGMFTSLGFGAPEFWAYFVGLAEVVGGLMLLLGVYVCYASAWLSVIMVVALFTAHSSGPFMGMYAPLAILGGCLALMETGAGKWSVMKKLCGKECCHKDSDKKCC